MENDTTLLENINVLNKQCKKRKPYYLPSYQSLPADQKSDLIPIKSPPGFFFFPNALQMDSAVCGDGQKPKLRLGSG